MRQDGLASLELTQTERSAPMEPEYFALELVILLGACVCARLLLDWLGIDLRWPPAEPS